MIKTTAKIALLMAALTLFVASSAYGTDFSTFRLRIEDTITGAGVVITGSDIVSSTNPYGINQSSTPDVIKWSGGIGSGTAGAQFWATVSLSYTVHDVFDSTLSLNAHITNQNGTSRGTIRLTLEDTGYPPPSTTATLTANLAGADQYLNPLAMATLTAGSTATFGAWINTSDSNKPNLGANGVYDGVTTKLTASDVVIPVDSLTFTTGGLRGTQYSATSFSDSNAGFAAVGPGNFSLQSQATLDLVAGGQAGFTLTSDVTAGTTGPPLAAIAVPSVPEPASLLLLGSGLVGLGVLRRKKYGRTV